ncbi:MAG: DUF1893 domain-containing protein, partial [Syntrophales bacterium]|nr:DUF1893 domain-containing protein [Syntrophales bacterium]
MSPLITALETCRPRGGGLIVRDRVVGLAAARLIVYAGKVVRVEAQVMTAAARTLLEGQGIAVAAAEVVESLL